MAPRESREARIREQRSSAARRFPQLWANIIAEWDQPGAEDCAWLMYSANYLFRTAGVRWAMDPIRLKQRLPEAALPDHAHDLASLSFVVLTHQHGDHLDLGLIRSLRGLDLRWIVPEALLSRLVDQAGVPAAAVIVPHLLQPIDIHGVRLTPFKAMHWEPQPAALGGMRGVPEMGYLVEFSGKRWLFPGDTRTYNASLLPAFGPADGMFAHVWLGRGAAGQSQPPLLDSFCRFCLDLQPQRIVLTHLQEFARDADEYWDEQHGHLVSSRLREMRPGVSVEPALLGQAVRL